MARRVLEQAMLGQPARPPAHAAAACSSGGSAAKRSRSASRASACMRSQSPCFARHEHRRIARQAGQPLGRVARAGTAAAQVGMQVVEDRDAGQEGEVGRIEVGQQQAHEMLAQRAAGRGHRRHVGARIAAAGHHRQRELQAQRPALGQLMQAGGGVVVDACTEAVAAPARSFRRA